MAKHVQISKKDNATKIVVDGSEISGVLSFQLIERVDEIAVLKLEIAIIEEIEVQR